MRTRTPLYYCTVVDHRMRPVPGLCLVLGPTTLFFPHAIPTVHLVEKPAQLTKAVQVPELFAGDVEAMIIEPRLAQVSLTRQPHA